jgi:hypothetical protein
MNARHTFARHSRESGNPAIKRSAKRTKSFTGLFRCAEYSTVWIPAFAGMTNLEASGMTQASGVFHA